MREEDERESSTIQKQTLGTKMQHIKKLQGEGWHIYTHKLSDKQRAFTCSVRLKVNVSSASGKSSSFTAMKMVFLDSVDSRKAAALMASKSPVSTPSSWVKQANVKL